MWLNVTKRRLGAKSPTDLAPGPSPRDRERVDRILSKISEETFLVFDLLKDGMVKEASFKTVEEGITRRSILSTFDQVRADAYGHAAAIAREHARRFSQAAADLPEPLQREFALAVAQAFQRFSTQLEAVEQQVGAPPEQNNTPKDQG